VLRRSKRLPKGSYIDDLIKDGDKIESRFLVIRKRENGLEYNRYAVNVSKKLEKSAVKRNRLRRQIYEIVRLLEKAENIKNEKKLDIIFFARKTLLGKSYQEIEEALTSLLKNL
jgi:ribonuclease P protein component